MQNHPHDTRPADLLARHLAEEHQKAHVDQSHPENQETRESEPLPRPPRPRTPKQQAASRANGAKSRGPVTPAGRRASRSSRLQHGLYAQPLCLSTEDPQRLDSIMQQYLNRFRPADAFDVEYVEQMVSASWRRRRYLGLQQSHWQQALDTVHALSPTQDPAALTRAANLHLDKEVPVFARLDRAEERQCRAYFRALRDWREHHRFEQTQLATEPLAQYDDSDLPTDPPAPHKGRRP